MKLTFVDRSPGTSGGPIDIRQMEERDDLIRRAMGPVSRVIRSTPLPITMHTSTVLMPEWR